MLLFFQIIDLDSQLSSLADLRTNQKERIQQLEGINKVRMKIAGYWRMVQSLVVSHIVTQNPSSMYSSLQMIVKRLKIAIFSNP